MMPQTHPTQTETVIMQAVTLADKRPVDAMGVVDVISIFMFAKEQALAIVQHLLNALLDLSVTADIAITGPPVTFALQGFTQILWVHQHAYLVLQGPILTILALVSALYAKLDATQTCLVLRRAQVLHVRLDLTERLVLPVCSTALSAKQDPTQVL